MPFNLNDPEKQATLNADYAAGRVPKFNPNNQTEAQAFVTYWNNLLGGTPVSLVEKKTYSFTVSQTER